MFSSLAPVGAYAAPVQVVAMRVWDLHPSTLGPELALADPPTFAPSTGIALFMYTEIQHNRNPQNTPKSRIHLAFPRRLPHSPGMTKKTAEWREAMTAAEKRLQDIVERSRDTAAEVCRAVTAMHKNRCEMRLRRKKVK